MQKWGAELTLLLRPSEVVGKWGAELGSMEIVQEAATLATSLCVHVSSEVVVRSWTNSHLNKVDYLGYGRPRQAFYMATAVLLNLAYSIC